MFKDNSFSLLSITTVFLLLFSPLYGKILPNFIETCTVLTPECLKTTVQKAIPEFTKGIPDLGINSTDPLTQERVDLVLPGNLKVLFHDGYVTGLRKCVVDSAKLENNVADINLHCNITIKGKYQAKGRILIVTINGDGDAKIKVSNVELKAKMIFEDETRNGINYYALKNYTVKHDFGDKIVFTLTDLFKGNPELSEAVLQFLNNNWKQVAEEFGNPIVETVTSLAFDVIKKFFSVVPKNELFS